MHLEQVCMNIQYQISVIREVNIILLKCEVNYKVASNFVSDFPSSRRY